MCKSRRGGTVRSGFAAKYRVKETLEASTERIKFLEKQNEETFKTAEQKKYKKERAMIDILSK